MKNASTCKWEKTQHNGSYIKMDEKSLLSWSLKIVKVENYKFHDNSQKNGRKGLVSVHRG
jgi:hypothetical protein